MVETDMGREGRSHTGNGEVGLAILDIGLLEDDRELRAEIAVDG